MSRTVLHKEVHAYNRASIDDSNDEESEIYYLSDKKIGKINLSEEKDIEEI